MKFSDRFAYLFKRFLPSPFTIAVLLTLFVLLIGVLLPNNSPDVQVEKVEFNESRDSLIIEVSGADHYDWSGGQKGGRLIVHKDKLPDHLLASNNGDAYMSEYVINYELTELMCDPVPCDPTCEMTLSNQSHNKFIQLLQSWETGMWNSNLLAFLVQMMLMLVLGHVLALSRPVDRFIGGITRFCTDNGRAVLLVSSLTIAVSLFNWGLGLIFGAIFARKVAEHASKKLIPINYALIGAAGYSGLMVWHGGISGSAPIKISEDGAMHTLLAGKMPKDQLLNLPESISFGDTIFSSMNLAVSGLLLVLIPLFLYFISRKVVTAIPAIRSKNEHDKPTKPEGAEKLDHSKILSMGLGLLIVAYSIFLGVQAQTDGLSFQFINPNYINLTLLGLCFVFHGSFNSFLLATEKAIGGTTGILLQFPLYFGILGLMKGAGLMTEISEFFIANSNEVTYPIYTFFSAGIVNIFVPSGGGQWAVQGPIVIESAHALGVPLNKSVMALAYGDQLTNMLQPFWALPLLGITGLKAKQILPYTLMIMVVGAFIFLFGLMFL